MQGSPCRSVNGLLTIVRRQSGQLARRTGLSLKWQEVAVALTVVVALVIARHVPMLAGLPLARVTGIACFGYAIFLSLRLLQSETATFVGGWSELRPSLAEKLGAGALGGFSILIVATQLPGSIAGSTAEQAVFLLMLALLFGAAAVAIACTRVFVELRWNHRLIEHRSTLGHRTVIAWNEVVGVTVGWQSVTIHAVDGERVRFSAYGEGAAELAERARRIARRNATA